MKEGRREGEEGRDSKVEFQGRSSGITENEF